MSLLSWCRVVQDCSLQVISVRQWRVLGTCRLYHNSGTRTRRFYFAQSFRLDHIRQRPPLTLAVYVSAGFPLALPGLCNCLGTLLVGSLFEIVDELHMSRQVGAFAGFFSLSWHLKSPWCKGVSSPLPQEPMGNKLLKFTYKGINYQTDCC